MNESQICRELVKQAIFDGCYAVRIEHEYMRGFPDLIMKHPDHSIMFLEVKFQKKETESPTIPNEMSSNQVRHIMRLQAIGLRAGLLIVSAQGSSYNLRFTSKVEEKSIVKNACFTYIKLHGKLWPIKKILTYHA